MQVQTTWATGVHPLGLTSADFEKLANDIAARKAVRAVESIPVGKVCKCCGKEYFKQYGVSESNFKAQIYCGKECWYGASGKDKSDGAMLLECLPATLKQICARVCLTKHQAAWRVKRLKIKGEIENAGRTGKDIIYKKCTKNPITSQHPAP